MDPALQPSLYDFLEIDAPRAVAPVPEPEHDDASDRFALLETDAILPAPEPAPDVAPLPDPEIASVASAERARDDRGEGLSDAFLADRARMRAARAVRAAQAAATPANEREPVATAPIPAGMEGIGDTLAQHRERRAPSEAPLAPARVEIARLSELARTHASEDR